MKPCPQQEPQARNLIMILFHTCSFQILYAILQLFYIFIELWQEFDPMRHIFKKFTDSMHEFRDLRSLTTLAMLMAVALVLNLFASIQITDSLRLGFGFIATAIMGMLYGPV